MDLISFKMRNLDIDKGKFGKIYTFVDFGNVNYWFADDRYDPEGKLMHENEMLIIDIQKLASFLNMFSEKKFFYYGFDISRKRSWHIHKKAENSGFIKVTKPIQFIRHYLAGVELEKIQDKDSLSEDLKGKFIKIPKSNFDVEISVDSIRLFGFYETFCLFSGDSVFSFLVKYLKKRGKKSIIIAPGNIYHTLREQADLYINSQRVKANIASLKSIKKKTPLF